MGKKPGKPARKAPRFPSLLPAMDGGTPGRLILGEPRATGRSALAGHAAMQAKTAFSRVLSSLQLAQKRLRIWSPRHHSSLPWPFLSLPTWDMDVAVTWLPNGQVGRVSSRDASPRFPGTSHGKTARILFPQTSKKFTISCTYDLEKAQGGVHSASVSVTRSNVIVSGFITVTSDI